MKPEVGYKTDQGKRSINADRYSFNAEKGYFIIADGLRTLGQKASKIAVDYVTGQLELPEITLQAQGDMKHVLETACRGAHTKVCDAKLQNSGTTLDVVVIKEDKMYTAHIGDSRIGILKNNGDFQVVASKGQSTTEFLEENELENQNLDTMLKMDSTLATYIGFNKDYPPIEIEERSLEGIKKIVLYTDGLEKVSNSSIEDTLTKNKGKKAAEALVELAKTQISPKLAKEYAKSKSISEEEAVEKLAGEDNITALVIELEQRKTIQKPMRKDKRQFDTRQDRFADASENLMSAMEFYEDRNYDDAIKSAQNAKNQDDPLILKVIANCYFKKGKYELAEDICNRVLELNKEDAQAMNTLGSICVKTNRVEDAFTIWSNAVKLGDSYALYNIEHIEEYTENIPDSLKSTLDEMKTPNLDINFVYNYERAKTLLIDFRYTMGNMTTTKALSEAKKSITRARELSTPNFMQFVEEVEEEFEIVRKYDMSQLPKNKKSKNHYRKLEEIYNG